MDRCTITINNWEAMGSLGLCFEHRITAAVLLNFGEKQTNILKIQRCIRSCCADRDLCKLHFIFTCVFFCFLIEIHFTFWNTCDKNVKELEIRKTFYTVHYELNNERVMSKQGVNMPTLVLIIKPSSAGGRWILDNCCPFCSVIYSFIYKW